MRKWTIWKIWMRGIDKENQLLRLFAGDDEVSIFHHRPSGSHDSRALHDGSRRVVTRQLQRPLTQIPRHSSMSYGALPFKHKVPYPMERAPLLLPLCLLAPAAGEAGPDHASSCQSFLRASPCASLFLFLFHHSFSASSLIHQCVHYFSTTRANSPLVRSYRVNDPLGSIASAPKE